MRKIHWQESVNVCLDEKECEISQRGVKNSDSEYLLAASIEQLRIWKIENSRRNSQFS